MRTLPVQGEMMLERRARCHQADLRSSPAKLFFLLIQLLVLHSFSDKRQLGALSPPIDSERLVEKSLFSFCLAETRLEFSKRNFFPQELRKAKAH